MVLGVLLLVVVPGGLVWLDGDPVGRHGRTLREHRQEDPPDDDVSP
jgi:hypothetical protein